MRPVCRVRITAPKSWPWIMNRHMKGIRAFGGYLMNSCHGCMNPRAVKTALYLGDGCRFISFRSHCTDWSATHESTVIDGKAVPFYQAFPKFKEQELPRVPSWRAGPSA